jgi:two-component system NtrC family sensor kinase
MAKARILVVADTPDVAEHLIGRLLPQHDYTAAKADEFKPPPETDVIVVDITQLRSTSPFAGLKAQRQMGCNAPAILYVPRLTEQMAADVFSLGVRELILKPVEDDVRMAKLAVFVQKIEAERNQAAIQDSLAMTQANLQRRLEEMSTLSRIGRTIGALTDLDLMLARIVEAGVYLTRADEGAVFLVDESNGQLVLRAEQGMGTQRAAALKEPSRDSDAMAVLKTGKPVLKGGETEHKVKTGYLARALVNVPIILGEHVIGVLAVYGLGAQSFEETDQAVLGSLADYAAIALSKVNSLDEMTGRVDASSEAARKTLLHAETLFDPVDGIESQADTLLAGGFGPLSEQQHTAVTRIKQATFRLKEVVGLMRQAVAETPGKQEPAKKT